MHVNKVTVLHLTLLLCGLCGASIISMASKRNPRVCIIGAGIAGLTSAKFMKEQNINFTVYEATKYVGGTWRYDPRVGKDENGIPVLTSMYKDLRTNLPMPAMELSGFPPLKDMPTFPSWELYYDYLKSYSKHFDLERCIQFLHMVVSVKRVDNIWKVKYRHVVTNMVGEEEFDYVIVGSGHHSTPNYPVIPKENLFNGTIIHSHDYREVDIYEGRKVLIVGAGPSAMDIALHVADVCDTLVHSHHSKVAFNTTFPPNFIVKPDIREFNETGVIFVDGTYEEIDDVIYCTGYQYDYPFLDESSGLSLQKRSVTPLYKYMVNINQPTMLLLGLVVRACVVVAIETQSRYATALIKGNFTLPPKEIMMEEWQRAADALRSQGRPLSHIHLLGEKEDNYYEELSKESGIFRVPPVLFKIRTVDTEAKLEDLYKYRDYVYTVIDRETFTRTLNDTRCSQRSCSP